LRISPVTGRSRQRDRADQPDRLEAENEEFFALIAAAYDELASASPERIRIIDAAQPPHDVLRDALAETGDLLLSPAG
jgi:dTMP kinase